MGWINVLRWTGVFAAMAGVIFFDVTKTAAGSHQSGLMRTGARLLAALGGAATPVRWPEWRGRGMGAEDWFLTAELFAPGEREGFDAFLAAHRPRTTAIFYDAIPLVWPQITWAQSVARHPHYLKMLARFGQVLAISEASRRELEGYWRWLQPEETPPVSTIELGADFDVGTRTAARAEPTGRAELLCVGIVEPRKNQRMLLAACERLWAEGLEFSLQVAGRMNPHFGPEIVRELRTARRRGRPVEWHRAPGDEALAELYARATATVFPTIAEGCGLPVLESLWRGVPCVCSDLPVLREHAAGGGCVYAPVNDSAAWAEALRRVLTDEAWRKQLGAEAVSRRLPTWAETAAAVRTALAG